MWSGHRHGQLLEDDTNMKKILFVTIALAMVGGIIAGCSSSEPAKEGDKAATAGATGDKAATAGATGDKAADGK